MSKSLLPLFTFLLLLPTVLTFNFLPTILKNPSKTPKHIHVNKHLQTPESTCEGTLYPELCISTVAALPELHLKTMTEVISHTVKATMKEVRDTASQSSILRRQLLKKLEPLELGALEDCLALFSDTIDELNEIHDTLPNKNYDDLRTLLSAAMTNQATCLDGFENNESNVKPLIQGRVKRISRHISNALAILKKHHPSTGEDFPAMMRGGFPSWMKKNDRKLLHAKVSKTKVNLTVAKDGSGDFTTINGALNAAPNKSETRFVIYIKAGSYFEYVEVGKKKKNIMFMGDGIGNTWIIGNRSVRGNWTTFRSATVTVEGPSFIAKGITFENYAGPSNDQAVALRSSADFNAFYKCSFLAYQDTLYVHTHRQFYRDCHVYGTIDFIFGNAAVVLQRCKLYARRPNPRQTNVLTAQSRDDPNQNTGISILDCKVYAAADLLPVLSEFKTYLGRPWRVYARTVYMFSKIEKLVDPEGWLRWNATAPVDKLYYGEYMNRGPGSNTSARVTWPGYRVIENATEASQFTVANLIQGNEWLPMTGIPFYPNLTILGESMVADI